MIDRLHRREGEQGKMDSITSKKAKRKQHRS
jgi:hypothetical protein